MSSQDQADVPERMSGVVLTGHGGLDKLDWRDDMPTPRPGAGQVLIRVRAASVNNTDINTRIGWYAKSVRGDTAAAAVAEGAAAAGAGAWSGAPLRFPRIQGADACGVIAAVGAGVDPARLGERVLVRALQNQVSAGGAPETWTFGSECDGAFAQFTVARDLDALAVRSDWSDLELASTPCAYSTAEGMLQRAGLGAEVVLITGASGGVGHAAVKLAKRRGARVVAVAGPDKADAVRALGADEVLDRGAALAPDAVEVVVDLVGGPRFPALLDALRVGGRYVVAGAIGGPIVELDLRTVYLKDLTLLGSTRQPDNIMPDVIGYIERGEISPTVATVYPLSEIRAAQTAFMDKGFVGKIGLTIP